MKDILVMKYGKRKNLKMMNGERERMKSLLEEVKQNRRMVMR